MEAIVLQDGRLHYHPAHPHPLLAPDDALVRLRLAGICATDLEMVRGYVPDFVGVLGHEFVGEVITAPDAAWVGRRVVASINIGCGQCTVCRQQGAEHCAQRQVLGIHNRDGVFAEYIAIPQANLLAVPDDVPDETAVFVEPLAAALRIREQIMVRPSVRCAVVGPGRLGLLVGLVLAQTGTAVTLVGRRAETLRLPQQLGLLTALANDLPDNQFDLVVDATGNEMGLGQSLRLVRPLGTLVLKSTFAGQSHLNLTKLVVAEITVVGSRCGPFAPALRLLADRCLPVEQLIEKTYPLAQGLEALAHAAQPGVRKVLLRPTDRR